MSELAGIHPLGQKDSGGFICDIGVIYHGTPHVSFTATGTGIDPADVEEEKKKLKDNIEDFRFYPVITLGLIYKF